jgi:hypothetical protein
MVCGFDSAEDFGQALEQPTLLVLAMDFGTDGCGHHGAMLEENIQYPLQLIEINPYELHPSASSVDPWKQGLVLLAGAQWLCLVPCRWQ